MKRMQVVIGNFWLLVVLAVFTISGARAQGEDGFTFYFPTLAGPYAVGHERYDITDPDRDDRTLGLDVWYPVLPADAEDAEPAAYQITPEVLGLLPLPARFAKVDVPVAPNKTRHLIVFSHGSGGFSTNSIALTELLATHGYIVASPDHTGNTLFGSTDPSEVVAVNRVGDVQFVIDHMMSRSADDEDMLYGKIKPDEVGVTGHSFGGFSAMGAVTGWEGIPGDPRIRAIAPIAGVVGESAFPPEVLQTVEIPVLLLGGTDDQTTPIELNDYAFDNLAGEWPVHQVDLIGANHEQFVVICDLGDVLIDSGVPYNEWEENIIGLGLKERYDNSCLYPMLAYDDVERMQNQFIVSFFRRYLSDGNFWTSRIYGIFLHPDWIWQYEPDAEAWRKSALDPFGLWY